MCITEMYMLFFFEHLSYYAWMSSLPYDLMALSSRMAPWVVIKTCDATDGKPRALFFSVLKIEFLSAFIMY